MCYSEVFCGAHFMGVGVAVVWLEAEVFVQEYFGFFWWEDGEVVFDVYFLGVFS